MESVIIFVTAMVISMAIVPLMIRLAPRIGMVDLPDPRKVHSTPIPRVGGVGIVLGALIPILFWFSFDPVIISYVFGCLVLLVFGVWDDSCELGHYVKFIGQFIAVLPFVYYADMYIHALPVLGDLSETGGKIFTVIAVVGMINAVNHSDGLDGLAGGMSLLSLACIGYMMYLVGDVWMVFLVLSIMGGVFGFLRFNSHPAKVFMGDGGSQFLGFSLGFLAVVLTQKSNPALSPALPLLFLGLPIADILAVFYLRISGGMNWFKATRNHIHHRLLDVGFTHYESVIIIYFIQVFLIVCSISFMYEYDLLIIFIYLTVVTSIFASLTIMERTGYKVNENDRPSIIDEFINKKLKSTLVMKLLGNYIVFSIPLIFLATSLLVVEIPADIGYLSLLLLSCSFLAFVFFKKYFRTITKLVLYVVVALIVYLDYLYLEHGGSLISNIEIVIYVLIAMSIVFVIKFDDRVDFEMSPMDYLVVIIIFTAFAILKLSPERMEYGYSVLKLILLFYGCELIEKRNLAGFNIVNSVALLALSIIAFRVVV